MIRTYIHNLTLIIACLYVFVRIRDYVSEKIDGDRYMKWVSAVSFGLLSVLSMTEPVRYGEYMIDIRCVPVFLSAYISGWQVGLVSAVFPTLFRLWLGGPTAGAGIILLIVAPLAFGGMLGDSRLHASPMLRIDIKRILLAHTFYGIILITLSEQFTVIPMDLMHKLNNFLFSLLCTAMMAIILNASERDIQLKHELQYLASHDRMTMLPILHHFKHDVIQKLEHGLPVAIAMIDIDRFKVYNDTHGHPAGDEVLRGVAQVLKDNVRITDDITGDLVARYGGEEFIICFTNVVSTAHLTSLAERIRRGVEQYCFKGEGKQPGGRLTISLGVSWSKDTRSKDDKRFLDELIERADKALYQSKENGRNRVTIAE